mmetsp:Transcript_19740/g.44426  ORF Transcript_19740/g.44426 Transcript_19740/m.44426 type:complete len:904 (+) Transcript_19740:70-2781(+)
MTYSTGCRAMLSGILLLMLPSTLEGKKSGNMNGKYAVASGAHQNVPWNDDYASKGHEYFDVWAPEIATHYAEAFWTSQGNLPLPQSIIDRFEGKVMAITGYEMDQVMVTPTGQPGVNPALDVSVPINWAYNHHYMAWMGGKHSEFREVPVSPQDPESHGATTRWLAVDKPSAHLREDTNIPTSQMFSEGNGGESRRSFHGYPNGYAQLIDSPRSWTVTPMQIDTRNRDCGVTPADVKNCTKFTPGPEPRSTRFLSGVPQHTNYSGLLECPCTGSYGGDPSIYGPATKTKVLEHQYSTQGSGTCAADHRVASAADCFAAAPTLGINATHFSNNTVLDAKLPLACSVMLQPDGSATAYFNTATSGAPCNGGTRRTGVATSRVGVTLGLDLDSSGAFEWSEPGRYCPNNKEGLLKAFPTKSSSVNDAYRARGECEAFCLGNSKCWGCSVDCQDAPLAYGVLATACQWSAITTCGTTKPWAGKIKGDVSMKRPGGSVATITVSGPADVWFGVGLNATQMADSPYTLIVNETGVLEQKIGTCGSEAEHCPGDRLRASVTMVSNTVSKGVRTVVMTRSFTGLTPDHYTFDPLKQTIPAITAIGSSQTFDYHKAHGPLKVSLTAVGTATCICDAGVVGKLCQADGTNCAQFTKNCWAAPNGDLLTQKNPTCNSKTYVGGLSCCKHKRILLDPDQERRPELLRYHFKFRFWFQEYKKDNTTGKTSHANLPRIYYQTEANAGEYDVPPAFALPGKPVPGYANWPEGVPTPGTTCTGSCPNGPDCECVHTITAHWTVSNMRLLYAGGHCHAPSCLSIELYRNDTGTPRLLCRQLPVYGQGNFPEDKFDEAGYVALPPCLWGEDEGLEPSQWLPKDTPVFSVKRNRNTHLGHYGEMASWQMRGVFFPSQPDFFV